MTTVIKNISIQGLSYCLETLERQTRYTSGDHNFYRISDQGELGIVTAWFGPNCPRVPKGYKRDVFYLIEVFGSLAQARTSVRRLGKMPEHKLFELLSGCRHNARILKSVE